MIGARFPDAIVKKIDTLVDSKDYLNHADVVRDFVKDGFERRENRAKVKNTLISSRKAC